MTVLAAVLAEDGAVVGADTAMTTTNLSGIPIVGHTTQKIALLCGGSLVLALTGETGAHGRIHERIAKHYENGHSVEPAATLTDPEFAKWLFQPIRNSAVADEGVIKAIAKQIIEFLKQNSGAAMSQAAEWESIALRQRIGAGFALFGRNEKVLLMRFEGTDIVEVLRPEVPFGFSGSGQKEAEIFYHFLRSVLYPGRLPKLPEAELAVYWSIQHAIDVRAPHVAGAPQLATMRHGDAKPAVLSAARLDEHASMVRDLCARLVGAFAEARSVEGAAPAEVGAVPEGLAPVSGSPPSAIRDE